MARPKPLHLLFGLEILGLALYSWHETVSAFVGWGKNRLGLQALILIAFVFLFSMALTNILRLAVRYLYIKTELSFSDLSRSLIFGLSPFLLLYLIFLPYILYLKDIRRYLLPVSLAGSACLLFTLTSRLQKSYPRVVLWPEFTKKWTANRLPSRRLSLLLFALSLAVYIILASGLVFPPQPFTGDEPHYLLITKSIIEDGDINLANNYQDQDYLDFYPGMLSAHAYRGKKGKGYLYSKHFPALPLLLVPAYVIGEKVSRFNPTRAEDRQFKRRVIVFFSRLPLCFFTALFGLVFFLLVFDITRRKALSISAWAIFGFTTPTIFYSQLIYPEIPAALLSIFILRNSVLNGDSRPSRLFLNGAGIGLLPWFGIKYVVLSVLLFGVMTAVLFKSEKSSGKWRRIVYAFVPLAVSASLYLFYLWSLYGGFSPVSVYKGLSPDQAPETGLSSILRTDVADFLKRSAGYFLDQRVGIFIYSPALILGIAGFFFFYKQKKKESLLLLAIFLVYGMFSAYYYWGGYCPPGRPLIPVLWILTLFLAVSLYEHRTRIRAVIVRAGTALSFLVVWVALKNPWILYHEDISSDYGGKAMGSNLFKLISNSFIDFQKMIPIFVRAEKVNLIPLIFWIGFLIFVVSIYISSDKSKDYAPRSLKLRKQTGIVFFLSLVLLTYVFFDIHIERKDVFEGQNYELYFQDNNNFGKELGGFWTMGKRRTCVILGSAQPVADIHLTLYGPTEGTTTIQVGPAEKKISRTKKNGLEARASFPSPIGFPWGKIHLYTITIKDNSGFYPYRLDETVRDNRYLGVFVKISR
jgi:hypothetical protein